MASLLIDYYLKYEIFDDFSSKQVLIRIISIKANYIFVFYFNRKVLLKI